jgi:hypothetical protein
MSDNFLNKKKFTKMIEEEVRKNNLSYIDAVVNLCENNGIEIEDVKKFLSTSVKERIEVEAMRLNFLPKVNTLFD